MFSIFCFFSSFLFLYQNSVNKGCCCCWWCWGGGDPPKSSSPPADSKTSSPSVICPVCSKPHTISNCDEFKKKAVKERLDFIQSVGLCFGCLGQGHYSKNCRKRLTCQKCKTPHPTILHCDSQDDKESKDSEKTNFKPDQSSSNTSHVCHTVGEGSSVTNSMIVPVWLHHKDSPDKEVLVYALLDDASDSTFIKSETLRDLCTRCWERKKFVLRRYLVS